MELRLSDEELTSAFDICLTENKADLELWVTSNFLSWNQSIAAAALRAWARCTDKILWHRLVPILSIPDLPQRIRFTILDLAPHTHGFEITKSNLAVANWEDFSGTFHALLTERALQFEIYSERLMTLSKKTISRANESNFPDQKNLFTAFAYVPKDCAEPIKIHMVFNVDLCHRAPQATSSIVYQNRKSTCKRHGWA
jgi:hypothetical protein